MENNKKFSGYTIAIACFVISFMHMGALGTIGVFMPAIAAENNFDLAELALLVSFATGAAAIAGMFIVAPLMKKMTAKWMLFASTFFIGGHYFLYATAKTLTMYYIAGTIGGSMIAFGTTAVVSNIIGAWFIEKRASMIGIVVGGASFGTAAWQALAGVMMPRIGYRTTYMIMGGVLFVVAILCNLLFVRTPEQLGQKPLGWSEDKTTGKVSAAITEGCTLSEAFRSPAFYILFLGVVIGGVAWTGFKTYMASLLTSYGFTTVAASGFTAFMNCIAAVGIIAGGFLAQKMGNRIYMIFLYGTCVIGCTIIGLTGSAITAVVLVVALVLGACSNCSVTSLPPTICTQAFGNKEYGRIIVYILSGAYVGQALTAILFKALRSAGLEMPAVYMFFGGCALAALVLCMIGLQAAPYRKLKALQSKDA